MAYLLGTYWPFMVLALLIGIALGWWNRDRRGVDHVTAWLEDGPREP
jgi:hypothetical protein